MTGKAGLAWAAPALLLCGLAACGSQDDAGPADMTVGEARALGEAAEMLESQRLAPTPSAAASEAP